MHSDDIPWESQGACPRKALAHAILQVAGLGLCSSRL